MGGKSQFPYMVDPNTDTSMYESDDIINYLFDKYGAQVTPSFPFPLPPSLPACLPPVLTHVPE